jgi:hypothetical protein
MRKLSEWKLQIKATVMTTGVTALVVAGGAPTGGRRSIFHLF